MMVVMVTETGIAALSTSSRSLSGKLSHWVRRQFSSSSAVVKPTIFGVIIINTLLIILIFLFKKYIYWLCYYTCPIILIFLISSQLGCTHQTVQGAVSSFTSFLAEYLETLILYKSKHEYIIEYDNNAWVKHQNLMHIDTFC